MSPSKPEKLHTIESIEQSTSQDLTKKQLAAYVAKIKSHSMCRPPRGAFPVKSEFAGVTRLWRLGSDGVWREDNHQPGLAFIGMTHDGRRENVVVWHSACSCPHLNGCTAGAASTFALHALDLSGFMIDRRRIVAAKDTKPTKKARR